MKTLITAISLITSAIAFGYVEYDLPVNGYFSDVYPRIIKSAYCINKGHIYSVSESVSISQEIDSSYMRPVPVITGEGDFSLTNDIDVFYGYSVYVRCEGSMSRDISSSDPNSYYGTFSGPVYSNSTDEADASTSNFLFKVWTKMDPDSYKTLIFMSITNTNGEAHHFLNNSSYAFYSAEKSATNLIQNISSVSFADARFISLYCQTNASVSKVNLSNKMIPFNTSSTKQLFSFTPGTLAYMITNNVNYMIPANFKISAKRNDAQSVVRIICE